MPKVESLNPNGFRHELPGIGNRPSRASGKVFPLAREINVTVFADKRKKLVLLFDSLSASMWS
jgi:hypothetical protein